MKKKSNCKRNFWPSRSKSSKK